MTTVTFGPGDYGGYNDWAFSGTGPGTFPINWNTSTFATGVAGRVTAIAARWDAYSGFCASTTGHNALWNTGTTEVMTSNDFTASGVGGGTSETMHNAACSNLWTGNTSYYIGFARESAKCSIHAWKDSAQGGYAGKAGSESDNSGGTANWGGSVNGGLPVFGTVTIANIYVRRGVSWTRVLTKTRRTAAWPSGEFVKVRRTGAWTIVNWLQQSERHLPPEGMPVEVDLGEGWERGWMVEEGEVGWFGSEDPTTQNFDWTKAGDFNWQRQPWTGRYNSSESNEVAEERLRARYEHDQAMRLERYDEARGWYMKFQPPILKSEPIEDPEPILVGCNCGG